MHPLIIISLKYLSYLFLFLSPAQYPQYVRKTLKNPNCMKN